MSYPTVLTLELNILFCTEVVGEIMVTYCPTYLYVITTTGVRAEEVLTKILS